MEAATVWRMGTMPRPKRKEGSRSLVRPVAYTAPTMAEGLCGRVEIPKYTLGWARRARSLVSISVHRELHKLACIRRGGSLRGRPYTRKITLVLGSPLITRPFALGWWDEEPYIRQYADSGADKELWCSSV